MQNWEVILLVAAAIVVVAIVGWVIYDRRRSTRLQTRFGPEYDRAVAGYGSRRRAEAELARRELYAKRLRDRRLNPADRERFIEEWQLCQGGEASTDALRQAFLHYKTLFDELLGVPHEESKRAA